MYNKFIKKYENFEPEEYWEKEEFEILPNKIYHTKTQESYNKLCDELVNDGYVWRSRTEIRKSPRYPYIFTHDYVYKHITYGTYIRPNDRDRLIEL